MPDSADYESALEAIWRDLRQHLEYADGFLLVFLYTRHPAPARELQRRAESLLQTQGLTPLLLHPRDAGQAHAIVRTIIAARPEPTGERPALWLDLWQRGSDAAWQAQRYEILARLNERRFLLEQQVGRPLVLVLPEEDRAQMHVLAPDLWTVRAYSIALPVPVMTQRLHEPETAVLPQPIDPSPAPVEMEWQRLLTSVPEAHWGERLDPQDGIAAAYAALARGDLGAAQRHAETALSLARMRSAAMPEHPGHRRVLALALGVTGEIDRIQGDLEAAHAASLESLEMSRQLRATSGDTPQAMRDLLLPLHTLGNVALDLGDLASARTAYVESLEIARLLRSASGDTPQALRDLLVSLERVGNVALHQGGLEAARMTYEENLDIARQLHTALGDTPQALRDLSISLEKAGDMALALCDLEAARSAYQESLEIGRQLRAALGDTPGVVQDLAQGLWHWGALQTTLLNPAAARAAFQEGLALAHRLVALRPDHPGYQELQTQFQAELDKLPA